MTINNQHGGPCRNSKAVFEGAKFCLPNVIEVKATEVGILKKKKKHVVNEMAQNDWFDKKHSSLFQFDLESVPN